MHRKLGCGLLLFCGLSLAGCGLFEPTCRRDGTALACGDTRFEVLEPSLVRLEYTSHGQFVNAPTAVVTGRDWPAVTYSFLQKASWVTLKTSALTLRYHVGSGCFTQKNLEISWQDQGSERTWVPGQADPLNLGGLSPSLDGAGQNHFPHSGEGILSRSGYFVLDDSHSPVWTQATQWIEPRPDPRGQDLYFLEYGGDYAAALQSYAHLVGPVPLPPRYALGAMITDLNYEYLPQNPLVKDYHYTDRDVENLVTRFRAAGIPLDVLVLDFAWHNFGWAGGYDWSPIFPHPRQFLDWAHQQGLKISLNDHPGYSEWRPAPGVLSDRDSHAAAIHKMLGIPAGKPVIWNLAEKRQAEAFMQILHFPLMDEGVDFWWVDGGSGAANMPGLDPQLWTNRVYYDFSQQHTGKRAFIMGRYGGWGENRYPGFFTGDTYSTWDMLGYEIPYTARGGNVLEPYITHDIGGFHGKDVPFDLYARWVEFGAFSPLLRLHSAFENPQDGNVRMPWSYGPQGVALARRYFSLRYALLPYLYTYARIAYDTGMPMLRPLYLEYPDLAKAYAYPKEYLFGKDILVAPVADPSGDEEVYLPPGQWTDYFSGKTYEGDALLGIQAPVDYLPLFVKRGAILPLAPPMDYSDQKPLDSLTFALYGPPGGSFRLYEDDGTTLGYQKNQFAWTPISFEAVSTAKGGAWKIEIGPAGGSFQGQVESRAYSLELHNLREPVSVTAGGKAIPRANATPGWSWDSTKAVATIQLPKLSVRAPIRVLVNLP